MRLSQGPTAELAPLDNTSRTKRPAAAACRSFEMKQTAGDETKQERAQRQTPSRGGASSQDRHTGEGAASVMAQLISRAQAERSRREGEPGPRGDGHPDEHP
jgi:hypothetical protein